MREILYSFAQSLSVIVDYPFVTGRSAGDLEAYTEAVLATWLKLKNRKFPV